MQLLSTVSNSFLPVVVMQQWLDVTSGSLPFSADGHYANTAPSKLAELGLFSAAREKLQTYSEQWDGQNSVFASWCEETDDCFEEQSACFVTSKIATRARNTLNLLRYNFW